MNSKANLSGWISEGINLYKANFLKLLTYTIVITVLSIISAGLLMPALAVAYVRILARLQEGSEPEPQFSDLFSGFDKYVDVLLFAIALFVVLLASSFFVSFLPLGNILDFIVSSAIGALIIFTLPLIAIEGLGFVDATKKSFETIKGDLINYFIFNFAISFLSGLGVILLGIGVVFTAPIYGCCLIVAYLSVFGTNQAVTTEPSAPAADSSAETV